jgi:acyl-CoA-dependent ceramide synthase
MTHISFPRARQRTRKFFEMSYYDAETQQYGRGWDDTYFVFFWLVLLTGMRAAIMDYVLKPFAKWGGVESKKAIVRFTEQGWVFLYYLLSWSLGMVSFTHTLIRSQFWWIGTLSG